MKRECPNCQGLTCGREEDGGPCLRCGGSGYITQKSTRVELVQILMVVQRSLPQRSHSLARIIDRAQKGKYHDWDSNLDTPKVALVSELEACRAIPAKGIANLKAMVMDGDFDEDPTEQQLAELREEVGPEEFDKLFPPPPPESLH